MQKTVNYTINVPKLIHQFSQLKEISNKNNWKYHYDDNSDALYFSPVRIEDKFTLFSIGDEFHVFVDQKSNLGGIFIEYYNSNLVSHEDVFKQFKDKFIIGIEKDRKKQEKKVLLTEVLKAEILSQLVNCDKTNLVIPA